MQLRETEREREEEGEKGEGEERETESEIIHSAIKARPIYKQLDSNFF